MNLILWLIVGAVMGGLATYILHDLNIKSLLINISIGIAGAVTTSYLITPMFYSTKTIVLSDFNLLALLISMAGAAILLSVVHLLHRKSTMTDIEIQTKWTQVRGKICTRWNLLTEEDLEQIDGNHDRFIDLLQKRYGCDEEKAEDDLQRFLRAVV